MLNAAILKERREIKGLSQAELARKIGREYQFIWDLEHSLGRDVRATTLIKLAEALDCSTDYLLGRQRKIRVA